jgi:hypothetical protein
MMLLRPHSNSYCVTLNRKSRILVILRLTIHSTGAQVSLIFIVNLDYFDVLFAPG